MPYAELLQRGQDRLVAALADPALPRLVAPAEVHGRDDPVDTIDDLVQQVDAELRLAVGVGELRADPRVDEQAEMRIVELGHRHSRVAQASSSPRSTGTSARMNASRVG